MMSEPAGKVSPRACAVIPVTIARRIPTIRRRRRHASDNVRLPVPMREHNVRPARKKRTFTYMGRIGSVGVSAVAESHASLAAIVGTGGNLRLDDRLDGASLLGDGVVATR